MRGIEAEDTVNLTRIHGDMLSQRKEPPSLGCLLYFPVELGRSHPKLGRS
jgi:hypothetical protein